MVFCRSCVPASLIRRLRNSSRCISVKMTKMSTMPVVVRGCSSGAIKLAMLSSAVGGGWRTSTGIGLASVPGVAADGDAPAGLSLGLFNSLPRS